MCLQHLDAYRFNSTQCDYPLHLGVTAAGPPSLATIKSAIGIGGVTFPRVLAIPCGFLTRVRLNWR